ncbi:DUF4188 domain-containing protein [Streptomyces andamanensis]|uniref:DUF4188 domain-containing protein n=1 Tax=Streptomyces andamanensis TaxID=1565035 RepID=A0ABV8THW1_9ACTN|nr:MULTISPECIES: DUF4188 domain-containing protein [unclassified Streptomyces]EYT83694.1 hypothetical protein CF54_05850 [Streptomyces sp. Tu 6176]
MSDKPIEGRMTAESENEVVVFLIGMRINDFSAVRSWWPVARAMRPMLQELRADKARGLLGSKTMMGGLREIYLVQYWESKEKLLAYAAAPDRNHHPAWAAFNRRLREGNGKVGFWHETFVVPAGAHEAIYINMPAYGLGRATGVIPVGRRGERAGDRLRTV